tara:strand:- start:414 stop:716 length:303 start_codon:yes stop_codon:yes gene_type:complete
MTQNKLGLTQEERTVFYKNAEGQSLVGEIRHFDPVYGLMKLLDPMKNEVIEFLWDSSSSTWKGVGVQSGYTTSVTVETPITKQTDSNVPGKASTVSRFPT